MRTPRDILLGLRTLSQWNDWSWKHQGIRIIDPDGFNRKDIHLWERKITKAEFMRGLPACTVQWKVEA